MKNHGYIYILTNPSFKEYVKIGYADDMKSRLAQLNRSECTPFAFRVYATYEVDTRLTDMKIHDMIDKINPNLRAIDNVEGKKRVREFYAMTAEDAYTLFEAMAEIHGTMDKLKKYTMTKSQAMDEVAATEIQEEAREKAKMFTFSMCNIPIGAKITYYKDDSIFCTVVDDRKVEYKGEVMSLTALAKLLMNMSSASHIAGPRFFKYNGEMLNDIREKLGV